MKQRAMTIFRCVSDDGFYAAHAGALLPRTRELVNFMRAHGRCSSWGRNADSPEAYAVAKSLIAASAGEPVSAQPRRRAA